MIKNNKRKLIFNILVGIIFLGCVLTFYTTFSLEDDYKFTSEVYDIHDGYVDNISSYTSIELFLDYFDMSDCYIKVVDRANNEISDGYVLNGSKTVVYNKSDKVIMELINIVRGDYNADGVVNYDDLIFLGKHLIEKDSISDYLKYSLDINEDNNVYINDLVLLDNALSNGYKDLSLSFSAVTLQSGEVDRIVSSLQPNYGLNQNVRYTSSDNNTVKVSTSGILTGVNEGETTVVVESLDGSLSKEVKVIVDNTIQLASYEGILYIGGSEGVVGIKAIDYEGITCSSSNENMSSCRIDGDKLILKGLGDGNSEITVTSPKYGSVIYKLRTYSTYLNLFPSYGCSPINREGSVIISSFHAGELTFDIKEKEIITNAYVKDNRFYVNAGRKTGRGEVIVKEANGNKEKTFVLDVYDLDIPSIGAFFAVGEVKNIDMIAEGVGTLTCKSLDEAVATCSIVDGKLVVEALSLGEVTIEVTNQLTYENQNYDCGKTTFLAVVRE